MAVYGLIGEKLVHSFSKPIHEQLTGEEYRLFPLSREEFPAFMEKRAFDGINVTIPYKEAVIPYCEEIDSRAKRIGAVNTLLNRNGRLYGFNTDYDGFGALLDRSGVNAAGRHVLILGSGGTSKTVRTVFEDRGAAEIHIVSRAPSPGELSYPEAAARKDTGILINTTPVGMFPNMDRSPMDLSAFPALSFVGDVIYNPLRTRLLQQAAQRGIPHSNGLYMLVEQARMAAELFREGVLAIPPERSAGICWELTEKKRNLVLTGMPVSGKSTAGRRLAQALSMEFVDADREVEKEAGMQIPEIFALEGEAGFRSRERRVIRRLSAQNGLVIATGGGAVLDPENIRDLRQNGQIFFLDRPLSLLTVGEGRPLAKSPQEIEALHKARYPLYCARCDRRIVNDGTMETLIQRLLEAALPES